MVIRHMHALAKPSTRQGSVPCIINFDLTSLWSLCWVQAKLVEQIGAMLTSFTQRKTEEVSRTVAGLHNQLDSGRTAIGSSIAELNNLSTAAAGHLQVQLCIPTFLLSSLELPPDPSNSILYNSGVLVVVCFVLPVVVCFVPWYALAPKCCS